MPATSSSNLPTLVFQVNGIAWRALPWYGLADIARHISSTIVNPQFLSHMASHDVASIICLTSRHHPDLPTLVY